MLACGSASAYAVAPDPRGSPLVPQEGSGHGRSTHAGHPPPQGPPRDAGARHERNPAAERLLGHAEWQRGRAERERGGTQRRRQRRQRHARGLRRVRHPDRGAVGRRDPRRARGRGGRRAASTYTFADDIGYAGDMERVLRETAEQDQPDIIFGDAFGNEEAVRAVAADYPDIAFVFGSGGGPAEPNFSVFDNWIHEPAYLAGMIAGGVTESNVHRRRGRLSRARGQPHRQRLHRRRAGDEPGRRRQGHVPQQLVRPGRRQGGGPGAGRCRRRRPVRGALRRHRGGGRRTTWSPSAT